MMRSIWQYILLCIFISRHSSGISAELLFHAPFDEGIDASVAGGNPRGEPSPASIPANSFRFVEGISGRAIDLGSAKGGIFYQAEGNIHSDHGTVTLWARRLGPKPEPREGGRTYTYHLFGWKGEEGHWLQLYRWEWHQTLWFLHGVRGVSDVGIPLPIDGDDGEWHFYALTWDGPHARAYVDGLTLPSMERADFPSMTIRSFYVGGGDATARAVDEVRIYDVALGPVEVRALYEQFAAPDISPTVLIPRRRAPIAIDGKLNPGEWETAAVFSGFTDLKTKRAAETQTSVRLLWDDEALWVAMETPIPTKVKENPAMTAGITGILKQSVTRFDDAVDHDDAFEINIIPALPDGVWHRLVVNGLNTHYDYTISPEGVTTLGWDPKWESASTLDIEGWHLEARLPFREFGAPPPREGAEWGLNIFRIWSALQQTKDAWRVARRPGAQGRYPPARVRFADQPTPIVQLQSWGAVASGHLSVEGRVINPTKEPAEVTVTLSSNAGEHHEERRLTVPPAEAVPFVLEGKIEDPRTGVLTLTAQTSSGVVLLRSEVPVTVRDALEIRTYHYPSAGILRIGVNANARRDVPLDQLSLTIKMLDNSNHEALAPLTLESLPGYQFDREISIASLKPGKYHVVCTLQQNEKALAERTFAFEKQPPPPWLGNQIGITTKAPKPFTPVKRIGHSFQCWGREYRFGKSLLPEQITTQGNAILTRPIELHIADAEGRVLAPCGATSYTWGKQSDFRCEFIRSRRFGAVNVEVAYWLECDGLLWVTLRILPCPVTLGKVQIRVPLSKEWSEFINTNDYSVRTTGRLPKEGWQGKDTPLWLGNGTGGIQWVTETLAPCRLARQTAPVRVLVTPQENIFELTLINVPTKLDRSFEVSWGWIATPVRPPTPGYRGWHTRNCDYYPHYAWYYPDSSTFDPRWEKTTKGDGRSMFLSYRYQRPDGRGEGITSEGPYIVTGQCSTKVPEVDYWGDEWSPSRFGRRIESGYGAEYAVVSPGAKSWEDFLVWTYYQTYKRQRYIGLYYDCALYMPDDNIYHGCGMRGEDGTVTPVNCILGARRIAQRLYCMLRENEPEQTLIIIHHSGMINMAVMSWCDVYIDGENFASQLTRKEPDYHRILTPDQFLAQSMGHNFGLTTRFEDQFIRSHAVSPEDWKTLGWQPVTHLYGLILLHDSGYWKNYGNPDAYQAVEAALLRYHFDETYQMIPYWKQKIVALPNNVFATFYRNSHTRTVLMVILNNNDADQHLRLRLDWKALGFDHVNTLAVDDAVFREDAVIENGELVVTVGRANMKLLAIAPKPVQ